MRFKKFLCYLLCGVLTFGVISTANYKSAHAMEWVSGALSFAETLTWVLASLGITCTVSDYATEVDKSRVEFWEDYEQEFYDYVNEHEGNTASDRFIEWKNKLCKGVLDKSSEYWSLFKSWASSLSSGGSSGEILSNNNAIINRFVSASGLTFNGLNYNTDIDNLNLVNVCGYIQGGRYLYLHLFVSGSNFSFRNTVLSGDSLSYYIITLDNRASTNNMTLSRLWGPYDSVNFSTAASVLLTDLVNPIVTNLTYSIVDLSVSDNSYFDSIDGVDTNDLDVISSDGVDEDSPEVTLPYPGVSDSDDTISSDAYQDIIDAINDGTITQEDGIIEIQKILKIITYDTVTDDVVPPIKDDDGQNKKKDDVLKENKENAGFSLGGLEAVFPFCIPFDIYAFMTLLVADPVAPEFDFPIKSVNGQEEEIHIDLSPFEPVAVVVRYCFDFLFIIGLGLITRQLIGAGGGD